MAWEMTHIPPSQLIVPEGVLLSWLMAHGHRPCHVQVQAGKECSQ